MLMAVGMADVLNGAVRSLLTPGFVGFGDAGQGSLRVVILALTELHEER